MLPDFKRISLVKMVHAGIRTVVLRQVFTCELHAWTQLLKVLAHFIKVGGTSFFPQCSHFSSLDNSALTFAQKIDNSTPWSVRFQSSCTETNHERPICCRSYDLKDNKWRLLKSSSWVRRVWIPQISHNLPRLNTTLKANTRFCKMGVLYREMA